MLFGKRERECCSDSELFYIHSVVVFFCFFFFVFFALLSSFLQLLPYSFIRAFNISFMNSDLPIDKLFLETQTIATTSDKKHLRGAF